MLGVMPTKYLHGCRTLKGEDNLLHFQNTCQEVVTLEEMLNTQYRTDAHFTCYSLQGMPQWPLLNKSILPEIREEGSDILQGFFAFDWDNEGHGEWTETLLNDFVTLLNNCQDELINSWTAAYTTTHGARLIYRLSALIPVDEAEKHLAWMIHHFQKNGFIGIDSSCKDYTRRFRCPQVMRDGESRPTWEQSYYSLVTQENILDMNKVGKRAVKAIATKTYFKRDKISMPTIDQLEEMLFVKDKVTYRRKQTEFHKRSKKLLKDSPYLDILFNDAAPSWGQGHRNDEIGKIIGTITPILLNKLSASIQQVFALVVNPLLTLDNDQDWIAHGWNILLDIYEREINKLNIKREQQADEVAKSLDFLDNMVEGCREWCDDRELHSEDEEAAREFVKDNCIASVGGFLYLMNRDGRYQDFALTKDNIISRIRKTALKEIIPTKKINYTGEEVDISPAAIINQYTTPVREVQMRPVGGSGGYITDINGERPALVISTFSRNDKLIPTFDPFVNEWLVNLFGEHFDTGCAWIGNALAFEEGLICALSMEGASAAGKKLLAEGLSECLVYPHVAGPEALYKQSSAFLKTPFLVIDESWPSMRTGVSPADKFKALTGGDGIVVDEKFKPHVKILCPVRMIMTANDNGIIRELLNGKNMGLNNRIAVGERLFHLKVSDKARIFLDSIGGRGHTAKEGARWIRPDSGSGSSDFVVAKHFLWLYHNRDKVNPSQRFLVMGNCAPGRGDGKQTVIETLLADSNHTPLVAQAIIELADNTQPQWRKYVRVNEEQTRMFVTRHGVHEYLRVVKSERLQERDVYGGLCNLMQSTEPEVYDGAHWYEISLETLANIATQKGISKTYVRTLRMNQITESAKGATNA